MADKHLARPSSNGTARLRIWVDWAVKSFITISVPVLLAWGIRTEIKMHEVSRFMEAGPRFTPQQFELLFTKGLRDHEIQMREEFVGREVLNERFERLEAILIEVRDDVRRLESRGRVP